MTRSIASFPVLLVCPACGADLGSLRCTCAAGTRFENDAGIPRLLFDQTYRGEPSSDELARIIELAERLPWSDALDAVVAVPAGNVRRHHAQWCV